MSKLGDLIKGFSPTAQAGEVAKDVISKASGIITKVAEGKQDLKEGLQELEKLKEQNITSRWRMDMKSDSWLSKNIRPLALGLTLLNVFALIWYTLLADTSIQEAWLPLLQSLTVTIVGGYFVVRSFDKRVKK